MIDDAGDDWNLTVNTLVQKTRRDGIQTAGLSRRSTNDPRDLVFSDGEGGGGVNSEREVLRNATYTGQPGVESSSLRIFLILSVKNVLNSSGSS